MARWSRSSPIILLTPDRRQTGWVKAITSVNAQATCSAVLVIAWILVMGFLMAMNLPATQEGGLALIGMFAGIFIFMGFIWAVIGE